jgi:hypothetical protein
MVPRVQGGMAMERKIQLSAVLMCREDLQKRFSELQKLKEQVRLAEIAAKRSQLLEEGISGPSDGRQ